MKKIKKRNGWVQLSDEAIVAHFPSILAGAKSVMGVVAPDCMFGKVLYNELVERVEFLFRNQDKSAHVLVSFEPGLPEHFHKDDHWGEF